MYYSHHCQRSQITVNKLIKFKNLKVIDLAADFRINDKSIYKEYYGKDYRSNNILKSSIYSLSEFIKDKIKKFNIISCPGCYPTSIQIPLLPLIKKKLINKDNIMNSKSGFSGAGNPKRITHKNIFRQYAYGIYNHRHRSEIDREFNKISKSKVRYIHS